MKAAIHKKYGPPEVVKVMVVEKPTPKNNIVFKEDYTQYCAKNYVSGHCKKTVTNHIQQ